MRDTMKSRAQFFSLLVFLLGVLLVITDGFSARIFAQKDEQAIFEKIEPIGDVIAEILKSYVYKPDLDKTVEGALYGIMRSLDRNSAYIRPEDFKAIQEDTQGEFDGIGIHILANDDGDVVVLEPIPNAPAFRAGIRAGDIIWEIDGVNVREEEMNTQEVARRIKGPRGQVVHLAIMRPNKDDEEYTRHEFDIKRGKIPLASIQEARVLDGGIAYIRIKDFNKKTAADMKAQIAKFAEEGMGSFILDLRGNPGGLLSASREVSELFLPKSLLVTSTRGRDNGSGRRSENMKLYTEQKPVLPPTMALIVLVNRATASSSEIVTGALQYHRRALIVGEKTYGKGSVQTIIPLRRPEGSALRLTTALYYTPADVTIDRVGIIPDVEVEMDAASQLALNTQMFESRVDQTLNFDATFKNKQNHGSVTGNPVDEDTVEDLMLAKAVEILREDSVFENLLTKYHKDPKETQVAAVDKDPAAGT